MDLAARWDWNIHQLDVVAAFLNGLISEEIFMKQAEGYVTPGKETLVLKIVKALYGLKQSGRAWNKKFHEILVGAGFVQLKCDPCFYVHFDKHGGGAMIIFHVDDVAFACSHDRELARFQHKLEGKIDITYLGELRHMLGVHYVRNQVERTITMYQTAFIDTVLA